MYGISQALISLTQKTIEESLRIREELHASVSRTNVAAGELSAELRSTQGNIQDALDLLEEVRVLLKP